MLQNALSMQLGICQYKILGFSPPIFFYCILYFKFCAFKNQVMKTNFMSTAPAIVRRQTSTDKMLLPESPGGETVQYFVYQ